MTYKRMFIGAAIVAFLLITAIVIREQGFVKMKETDLSRIDEITRKTEYIRQQLAQKEEIIKNNRRALRRLDELIAAKSTEISSLKANYEKRFKVIKGMSKDELVKYIHEDSNGDSTILALHLEERKECLQEKDMISKMFDLCSQKGLEQDSIIAQQDTVIRLNETLVLHAETERDIYSDEVKRISKKLKRQKIINKIGIVAAVLVVIIVGGN